LDLPEVLGQRPDHLLGRRRHDEDLPPQGPVQLHEIERLEVEVGIDQVRKRIPDDLLDLAPLPPLGQGGHALLHLAHPLLVRPDHYVSFGREAEWGSLDAWATIAALSARTERVRLGTLVSPVTFRHPSQLAKAVVTADHASGGRVELGMGAGWFEREHRAYGFPFPETRERLGILEEQVEIVHRLWDRDERAVSFEGRHYRLEACRALPKPVQVPHPPLILGGQAGPRAARLAARWADEYNVNMIDPPESRRRRQALDRACERAGRDPASLPMSLMTFALVGSDRKELEARAARLLDRQGNNGDPGAYLAGMGSNRIAGTVDEVVSRLAD